MNILIYSNVFLWEQHISETLEIIQTHLKKGDTVYLLGCDKTLISCPPNSSHNLKICSSCIIQKKHILNKIFENKLHEVQLNLEKKKYIKKHFKNFKKFLNFKYKKILPVGELSMSTHTDFDRDFYTDFKKIRNKLMQLANNSIALFERSVKVIRENNIDVVYVWNGRRHSDGPILYAAKFLGKKYFSYLSGGTSTTYMKQPTLGTHDLNYSKKRIKYLYAQNRNRLLKYKKEAELFFHYMRYGGSKSFGMIYFKDFFDNKINFTPKSKKKKLVIFTSSYWEFLFLGHHFRYKHGVELDHYKYLEKILSDKKIYNVYDIYVRWHPHTSTAGPEEKKKINYLIRKYQKAVHYDYKNKMNSYLLMHSADRVISFGSTTGCEATFYGKVSILLGPAYYEDLNCVYEPRNYKSLLNLLFDQSIKPLPKINALKYAYHERHKGEYKFKYIRHDKFFRYYFNGERVKKFSNVSKIIREKIVILITMLKLRKFLRIIFYKFNKILGTNVFLPHDW